MVGKVGSYDEWRQARLDLLAKEKELTRKTDELVKQRGELPMVKVDQDYQFTGPDGPLPLGDLFHGRRQLIVYHFMFAPEWEQGCKNCSFLGDQVPTHMKHLNSRETTFVFVSRAPMEKIAAHKKRLGWTIPWYSSHGSMFNYEYHATADEEVKPVKYNFKDPSAVAGRGLDHFLKGEQSGFSVFYRDGDEIYHTYSCWSRGGDNLLLTYGLLDLTPLGKQEEGNDWMFHDKYPMGVE